MSQIYFRSTILYMLYNEGVILYDIEHINRQTSWQRHLSSLNVQHFFKKRGLLLFPPFAQLVTLLAQHHVFDKLSVVQRPPA